MDLKTLFASETIRQFNSRAKKTYKLALCGIVADTFDKGQYAYGVHYGDARTMATMPEFVNQNGPGQLHNRLVKGLESFYFYDFNDSTYVDKVIGFFRKFLNDYDKKKKRFYLLSEVKEIYDVEKLLNDRGYNNIKNHHWLDISFYGPITPTFPEFYNYIDLLNLWNDFVGKKNELSKMIDEEKTNQARYRELVYSASSSTRAVIISAVTYVEAYLYYYFYNIKNDENRNTDERIKGILNSDGFVQDKQIVEKVIFKLHPEIKNNEAMKNLYKKYKEDLKIRDRYVHLSAFVNETNQMSELQPLITLSEEELEETLQNCIDFTYTLDGLLPENEKILFWWERFESPIFKSNNKINTLNLFS